MPVPLSEKQKMLAGENYHAADPQLVAERLACRQLLYQFNHSNPDDQAARERLLGQLLGRSGTRFHIEPPFYCDYGSNIVVGDNFYANFGCTLLDVASISCGDNVQLGPGVQIYTATHPLDPDLRLSGQEYGRSIRLGDNVWIGGAAIICPGVSIGNNAIVAAGSVVTKDVADNILVGGNPAQILKALR